MGAKNDSGKHSDAWGYEGSAFQKFVLSFADDQWKYIWILYILSDENSF